MGREVTTERLRNKTWQAFRQHTTLREAETMCSAPLNITSNALVPSRTDGSNSQASNELLCFSLWEPVKAGTHKGPHV